MKDKLMFGLSISIIICFIIFSSCSTPLSKESYLKKYESFIEELSKNYKTFDDNKWEKIDKKHNNFSDIWYDKFKEDLTIEEKVKITGFQFKYNYYRTLKESSDFLNFLNNSINVDTLKNQIKYYLDNNMQDDLNKLYEEAKKAGENTESVVKDLLEEMDVDISKLEKQ